MKIETTQTGCEGVQIDNPSLQITTVKLDGRISHLVEISNPFDPEQGILASPYCTFKKT